MKKPILRKKILFSGFPYLYFKDLAKFLSSDYDVYWIFYLRSDYNDFLKSPEDFNASFVYTDKNSLKNNSFWFDELIEIEKSFECNLNDILLMDRFLIRENSFLSKNYLFYCTKSIYSVYESEKPDIILTWRDTAPQIISFSLGKYFNIPSFIPTRIRIPSNFFGFNTSIFTNSFFKINDNDSNSENLSSILLNQFKSEIVKPELKIASRNFLDVFKLLPNHFKAFFRLLKKVTYDKGNYFNRYSIFEIISFYVLRRINLLLFKLFKPYHRFSYELYDNDSFCFYPLHTQPESSIDVQASLYSNQYEVILKIIKSLPINFKLIVKIHPTDVDGKSFFFYKRIKMIPNVILVNYDVSSNWLIKNSKIVFTLTGTAGFESALHNKAVIVFSNNFFNIFPNVFFYDETIPLKSLINKVLDSDFLSFDSSDIVKKYSSLLESVVEGSPSRVYGASYQKLNNSDFNAYLKLINYVFKS
jgi:hypothetical protein